MAREGADYVETEVEGIVVERGGQEYKIFL